MTPYHTDPWLTVYQGDCREVMAAMEPGSVHCVVTSPPYWALRDYGVDGALGLEPTPEEYVANMVGVFREVRRVLRDDGTCWVNLGDSYAATTKGSGGTGKSGLMRDGRDEAQRLRTADGSIAHQKFQPRTFDLNGLKPKDLVGIPWRLAFALQADGWYLRSDIIWSKPNPMPESVTDRPTKAHEYVFLLSKSPRYWYDAEAVREEALVGDHPRSRNREYVGALTARASMKRAHDADSLGIESGRNLRSVWSIATQPYPGAHFATFPEKLVEPCIKAGCPDRVCADCGNIIVDERETSTTGQVVRGVRAGLPGEAEQSAESVLFADLLEPGDIADAIDDQGVRGQREGLHPPLPTGSPDGDADGLRRGASPRDGGDAGPIALADRGRGPHQRDQERQQAGEPAGTDQEGARRSLEQGPGADGPLPRVRRALRPAWACGQCGADLREPGAVAPGVVLDCFAGSGTTGRVAQRLSRRAVLIDLNAEYLVQAMGRNLDMPLGLAE